MPTELATIVDAQGRTWTGIVVNRRPHWLRYLLALVITGGLAGLAMRIPDTVTVRVLGEEHSGEEKLTKLA